MNNIIADKYNNQGFVSPIDIISARESVKHRQELESAEDQYGPMHYKSKIHTVFKPASDLATNPKVLDIVESILGPDILLFDVTYIIKEPKTMAHVSWHQDLTYWGFDNDEQITLWLALSTR